VFVETRNEPFKRRDPLEWRSRSGSIHLVWIFTHFANACEPDVYGEQLSLVVSVVM